MRLRLEVREQSWQKQTMWKITVTQNYLYFFLLLFFSQLMHPWTEKVSFKKVFYCFFCLTLLCSYRVGEGGGALSAQFFFNLFSIFSVFWHPSETKRIFFNFLAKNALLLCIRRVTCHFDTKKLFLNHFWPWNKENSQIFKGK